jgi:RHS repeat-associated protein
MGTKVSATLYYSLKRQGAVGRIRFIALLLMLALYLQCLAITPIYAAPKANPSKRPTTGRASKPLTVVPQGNGIVVFGPRRIDRTGPLTRFSDQFTLPGDAVAPFNIQVANGDLNGQGRVLTGEVQLNGQTIVRATELNVGTASLTKPVQLLPGNTLSGSFFGRFGAHLSITFTATRATTGSVPVINSFTPTEGPPGTLVKLTGTNLKVNNTDPSVTFAGSNNSRQPAQVVSATAPEVNVTVPNGAQTGPIELTTVNGVAQTSTPFTVHASQNFELSAMPGTVSAVQRSSGVQVVAVTSPQSEFSQLVRLQQSGLPAGVVASFAPDQITAGASSTLTLNLANVDLSPGAYPFTLSGTAKIDGHDVVHTFAASLNVIAAGQTSLTGRVLSTEQDPIIGATVSLDGRTATTDSAGTFLLVNVTAGQNRPVMIDGRTASAPNKSYPVIIEPATVVANQVNTVPFTFYLPAIDTQFEKVLVPNQITVVDNPRVPDLAMTIPANANLRNRDGTPVTRVSISPVEIDRVPAPLPSNLATNMVYTSQPGGAVTMNNVAMPVVYPNLAGANPNTRITLYYFDHDAVIWRSYGFGRVSQDGLRIEPEIDPSTGQPYGLPNFSWHFPSIGPAGNPGDPGDCPPSGGGGGGKRTCPGSGPCNRCKHPVDYSTGVKIENSTDMSFGGARGTLSLTRTYTSDLAQSCDVCPFGRGTTHNYDIKLTGDFTANNAGRVKMPEQVTGRLFGYNSARSASLGIPVFTSKSTTRQLGDEVRKLNSGNLEYHRRDGSLMTFNSSGRLLSMTDTNNNTVTLSYAGNNLTGVTDPVGRSITLAYDSSGRITSATDPLGRIWRYTYEGTPGVAGAPGLTTVTDPLSNVTRYTYVTGGRLSVINDARGNAVKRVTYDGNGRVIQQQFADNGIEHYDYILSGTIVTGVTITDALGRVETKRFNASGYVTDYTDALGQHAHIERDMGTNLPTSMTGPCGCTEGSYEYDDRGNLTKSTDRLGGILRMEYEPVFNRLTRTTDELGRVTNYAYDSHGNLTSMTDALGRITSYVYDGLGELISITDPLGHVKQLVYDAQGNITSFKDALNDTTMFEYDEVGRLTAMVDPLSRRAGFAYDSLDRITSLTDPAGAATTLEYDPNGNLTSFINALSQRWNSVYDSKNRLVSTTDSLGRVMRRAYDKDEQLLARVSASGRTTRYSYDPRGQMLTMTTPLGFVTHYEYDNSRNLIALTDARNNVTTFTYDELYRLSGQRDPLGHLTGYTYDAADNVTERHDRLGRSTAYTYDSLNRPTRIQYADATVNYGYDPAYRLTHIDDTESGAIDWAYDNADRLLSETTPQGIVSYTYNAASQRASMTAADRPPVNYTYDNAGRLATIAQTSETFTYAYDTLSRVASLQRPNSVRTNYAYDNVYRLARLKHTNSSNQALEDFQYTYNADDEIESINSLASATLLPTGKTAAPADAANRLPQFGTASYTFDNEGQTTSRNEAPTVTNFTWDARGRLTQATLSNGQNINYTYDGLGRRSSQMASGVTTNFLYDRLDVVFDIGGDASAVDYLNGPGIDNKLSQGNATAGKLYFLQDHLGSDEVLTDTGGNIAERAQYDAFGETVGISFTRYGYTGREQDTITHLLHYRARWYEPHQGRFITEDPMRRGSGQNNLYSYVLGNPLSFTDPLGLDVTVNLYSGALGAGHVGIGVNKAGISGFYGLGWESIFNLNVPGEMRFDTETPEASITIPTTPAQDRAVLAFINARWKTPGDYNLYFRNCVTNVRNALKAGGIETPETMLPRVLMHNLQQQFGPRINQQTPSFSERLMQEYIRQRSGDGLFDIE